MYSKILIPIADHGPERADRALAIADALREAGGEIILLHVIEKVPAYVLSYIPEDVLDRTRDESTELLEAIAGKIEGPVQTVVKGGHSGQTIVEFASETGADCIVISSHRPELQDVFFGSTAAHVVRHAVCSVHVLR